MSRGEATSSCNAKAASFMIWHRMRGSTMPTRSCTRTISLPIDPKKSLTTSIVSFGEKTVGATSARDFSLNVGSAQKPTSL